MSRPCRAKTRDAGVRVLIAQAMSACPPAERARLQAHLDARAPHLLAGAAAQESGNAWEAWCEAQHKAALSLRLALLRHYDAAGEVAMENGAPMRDRRGRILKAQTGKSPTDYVGHTLSGTTRAVYVEAKWRGDNCLHRDRHPNGPGGGEDRQGIYAHQIELLESAARAGHIALVVVGFDRASGPCHYAVEWLHLESLWITRGKVRSVGPSELAGTEVVPGCYLARWIGGTNGR